MAELPYRPEHVNDAIADSEELTNEELGAFIRLQRAMWRAGGLLDADPKRLARFARAGSRWGKIAPAIMAKLTILGGKVSDPALMTMLDLTRNRRRQKAEAAAASNAAQAAARAAGQAVGNSRADPPRKSKADMPLTSSNPLKTNEVGTAGAVGLRAQDDRNQNQNHLEEVVLLRPDAAADAPKGSFEEAKDKQITSALNATLYEAGVELLHERVGLDRKAAKKQIAKWLVALDDPHLLAKMLAYAEYRDIRGPDLINLIDAPAKQVQHEREVGPLLPLRGVIGEVKKA